MNVNLGKRFIEVPYRCARYGKAAAQAFADQLAPELVWDCGENPGRLWALLVVVREASMPATVLDPLLPLTAEFQDFHDQENLRHAYCAAMCSAPLLLALGAATASTQSVIQSGGHMNRLRILIADDHEAIRLAVRALLGKRADWEVCGEAVDGCDALEKAKALTPDVVVLDVRMPKLGGLEAASLIKKEVPQTEILILSVLDPITITPISLRSGARGFVSKDRIDPDLLVAIENIAAAEKSSLPEEASIFSTAFYSETMSSATANCMHDSSTQHLRLRDLFAYFPAPMCLLTGADHRYDFVNAAYTRVAGRSREELLGRTVRQALPELAAQGFVDLLDRVYRTGEPFVATEREMKLSRHGRTDTAFFDFTYYPVPGLDGQVAGVLFQGIETTAQVLAKNQLEARVEERTTELQKVRDDLRSLNHRLLEAQEEERRRLALELHDSAGQLLAALKWKMDFLQDEVRSLNPGLQKCVADSLGFLDELTKELRTVSHLLHPPCLEEAGLSALHLYLEGMEERSGLVVELDLDREWERLPRELEVTIFRVIQEALTNIHRHAETSSARVGIHRDDGRIRIQVQDHGKGIAGFTSLDSSELKMGVGLRGMRERIRELNGRFEILSNENGTTVNATLPLTTTQIDTDIKKAC